MPAPTYSVAAALSQGSRVRVGRGDTPTWTPLPGAQDVEFPDRMPADLDITHQDSPGFAEENMPGITPAVDWSLDMIRDVGSDAETALLALDARNATTGLKELHLLEITVGKGASALTKTFVAYLKQYKPLGALKGRQMTRATWRVMAEVAP